MIDDKIREKIISIVGRENCLTSDLERFAYSYDSSFIPLTPANKPELVARPQTTEEVSRLLTVAYENQIPVTPRGAASGRSGGSIPLKGGISLALDRMSRIIELDPMNMTVMTEPGVRTIDLYNYAAARGLFYPPDPASWKFSTIGGNVAENAGGMRAVKYGVTGNYVMGLEVVLADGTILQTGGKAIKNVTGYDLKSLFVGSEGTLGIITRALLRLIPLPPRRGTLQIMFGSLDDGCATVHQLLCSGIVPSAAEIMDRLSLDAVARHRKMSLEANMAACLIIEIDGDDDSAIAAQTSKIKEQASKNRALAFRTAESLAEADELWAIRRGVSSALAAMAPNRISEDISVPRDVFPEVVRRIQAIAANHGLSISVYGHAGDGNLHPSILCDMNNPQEARRVHRAIDDLFAVAIELGGTLSGEHGIGITKQPYIVQAVSEAGVKTMQAIKQALDPRGILNPGKIWQ